MSENTEEIPLSNRQGGGEKRNRHYAIFENTILATTSDSDDHETQQVSSAEISPTRSDTTTNAMDTRRPSASSQHSIDSSSTTSKLTITTSPPSTERARQRSPSPSSLTSNPTSAEAGPSHLFWVPAHLHSDIAPAEFDSFITKHSPPTSPVSSSFPSSSHTLIPTITTDLALDLAYANETNEAALPRLRTLSRRRSSLRRATKIDFDDEDDDEDETEESMNQRIQMERQKSADRLSLYANKNRLQNEGTKMLGLTSLRGEEDESSEDVVRDAEAMMEDAQNDASGAAAALKRNLSVRLSAMSEYSPENDYDNQTLSRPGSLNRKSSGGLLRRGVRTRIRRESLPENLHVPNEGTTVAAEEPPPRSLSPSREREENEPKEALARSLSTTSSTSSSGDSYGGGVTTGRVIVGLDGEITLITDDSASARRASDSTVSPSPVPSCTEGGSAPLPLAQTADDPDHDAEKEQAVSKEPSIKSDGEQLPRPKVSGSTTNTEESVGGKEKDKDKDKDRDNEKDKDKDKETKPKKSSPWSWFRNEEREAGKKSGFAMEQHDKAPDSNRSSRKSVPNLSGPASSSTATGAPPLISSVSAPDLHKDSDGTSLKGASRSLERSPSSTTKEKMKKSMTSLLFSKAKVVKTASTSSLGESAPTPESTTPAPSTASPLPASTSSITAPTPSASPKPKPTRYTNYVIRYPIQVERGIYRLSHAKLANPRRPLLHQVLISNMMFWYLALISRQQKTTQQQYDTSDDEEEGEKERKERRRWEKEEEKARKKRAKEAKKAAAAEGKKKKKEGKEKEKEKGLGLF